MKLKKRNFKKFLEFLKTYDKPRCNVTLSRNNGKSVCLLGALNEFAGYAPGDYDRAYADNQRYKPVSENRLGVSVHLMYSFNDRLPSDEYPTFQSIIPLLEEEAKGWE